MKGLREWMVDKGVLSEERDEQDAETSSGDDETDVSAPSTPTDMMPLSGVVCSHQLGDTRERLAQFRGDVAPAEEIDDDPAWILV